MTFLLEFPELTNVGQSRRHRLFTISKTLLTVVNFSAYHFSQNEHAHTHTHIPFQFIARDWQQNNINFDTGTHTQPHRSSRRRRRWQQVYWREAQTSKQTSNLSVHSNVESATCETVRVLLLPRIGARFHLILI